MSPTLLKHLRKAVPNLAVRNPQLQWGQMEPSHLQDYFFLYNSYRITNHLQKYRNIKKYPGLSFPICKIRDVDVYSRVHGIDKWKGIILSTMFWSLTSLSHYPKKCCFVLLQVCVCKICKICGFFTHFPLKLNTLTNNRLILVIKHCWLLWLFKLSLLSFFTVFIYNQTTQGYLGGSVG